MHHHIGPPLDRADQIGLRHAVVHHQGHAHLMGHRRHGSEVVGTAVEGGTGDDVIAGFGEIEQGNCFGPLAARHQQSTNPSREGGEPFLHRRLGGIHDAGVDVAQFLKGKQVGGVVGVAEGVGGGPNHRLEG